MDGYLHDSRVQRLGSKIASAGTSWEAWHSMLGGHPVQLLQYAVGTYLTQLTADLIPPVCVIIEAQAFYTAAQHARS
jgi:hypothetical protein